MTLPINMRHLMLLNDTNRHLTIILTSAFTEKSGKDISAVFKQTHPMF